MKYQVMNEQRGTHGVEKMAEVLGVARSGYYSWIEGGQSTAVEEKKLVEDRSSRFRARSAIDMAVRA